MKAILVLVVSVLLIAASTVSHAQQQPEETSWWASNMEPEMLNASVPLDASGHIKDPASIEVQIIWQGRPYWVRGYEAVVFLLTRDYFEFVDVGGRKRLRPTAKFKSWRPGPGVESMIFSGEFPEGFVKQQMALTPKKDYLDFSKPKLTFTLMPDAAVKGRGGMARISPNPYVFEWEYRYGTGQPGQYHMIHRWRYTVHCYDTMYTTAITDSSGNLLPGTSIGVKCGSTLEKQEFKIEHGGMRLTNSEIIPYPETFQKAEFVPDTGGNIPGFRLEQPVRTEFRDKWLLFAVRK